MQNTTIWIQGLLSQDKHLKLTGKCHDCKQDIEVLVDATPEGFTSSLPIWKFDDMEIPFFKCEQCFKKEPHLKHFQSTEVWSRVVGYLRPIKQWNPGKQAEKDMRTDYVF